MAEYITQNTSGVAVNLDEPARNAGGKVKKALFSHEKTAAQTDGTVLILVPGLSPDVKPVSLKFACDAIAGLTDVDFGFYKSQAVGGAELDADILKDGLDPHAGISTLTEQYAPALDQVGDSIADLCVTGAQRLNGVDLCATLNTGGTAVGTICGVFEYLQ